MKPKTKDLILIDLAQHPNSTPGEIATRLCVVPQTINRHFRGTLRPVIVISEEGGGARPNRWSLISGVINWCPFCGHTMERLPR